MTRPELCNNAHYVSFAALQRRICTLSSLRLAKYSSRTFFSPLPASDLPLRMAGAAQDEVGFGGVTGDLDFGSVGVDVGWVFVDVVGTSGLW